MQSGAYVTKQKQGRARQSKSEAMSSKSKVCSKTKQNQARRKGPNQSQRRKNKAKPSRAKQSTGSSKTQSQAKQVLCKGSPFSVRCESSAKSWPEGKPVLDYKNARGLAPLHLACSAGREGMVLALAKGGASAHKQRLPDRCPSWCSCGRTLQV